LAKPHSRIFQVNQDESELKNDALTEDTYYKSLKPPVTDVWGGLPNSQKKFNLKATGFFHTEKHGERWIWLIRLVMRFFISVSLRWVSTTIILRLKGAGKCMNGCRLSMVIVKTAWMNKDVISFISPIASVNIGSLLIVSIHRQNC